MAGLGDAQIAGFIRDGFVRIDHAFPRDIADDCRDILWRATGCDRNDPKTWMQPVIRLGGFSLPPFLAAANTPILHAAYDQLVGRGHWQTPAAVGTFPVRFPSSEDPGDAGWHIDASFGTESPDFLSWRVNIASQGRALLMLFLFSDIGEDDAPTRIRIGSHIDMARRLAPAGDAGLTLGELAVNAFTETASCPETLATGDAGTVYLCHPFLVHAAQMHRGRQPRFMAQPPLMPARPLDHDAPVGYAIRQALAV